MDYVNIKVENLQNYCETIFYRLGFSKEQSLQITDVLLKADLFGIESHGVQRLIRYYKAFKQGSINPKANKHLVFQSPIARVYDAPHTMGQIIARQCMEEAIEIARLQGIGIVCARRSNHYGIAGYYTLMAAKADMMGISMTNTEAIAIPTYGSKAMLGTNPIALCMPADPRPFWYDASTTVVTRGKLEVYKKRAKPLVNGWAADAEGRITQNADLVIENIIQKLGGGIFPLGGDTELTGSHKGYGFGIIVELFTSIFAGGSTSPHVKSSGNADTSFSCIAIDYGVFGDKKRIKSNFSQLLQELRESPKAKGQDRIYIHGEKEFESEEKMYQEGIPVNRKTLQEIRSIGMELKIDPEEFGV